MSHMDENGDGTVTRSEATEYKNRVEKQSEAKTRKVAVKPASAKVHLSKRLDDAEGLNTLFVDLELSNVVPLR